MARFIGAGTVLNFDELEELWVELVDVLGKPAMAAICKGSQITNITDCTSATETIFAAQGTGSGRADYFWRMKLKKMAVH